MDLWEAAWGGLAKFVHGLQSGDWLTFITIVGATGAFWFQHVRTLRVEKIELYQRLESNSLDVFAFEAEHADVLEKYRDEEIDEAKFGEELDENGVVKPNFSALQKTYGSMKNFIEVEFKKIDEDDAEIPDAQAKLAYRKFEKEWRVTRKYYEQTLNLFEMATRFRHKKIIEPVVYGSWVIWFYDTVSEWSFRRHWEDLKQNYTPDLRNKFNLYVQKFNPGLKGEEKSDQKEAYFEYIGTSIDCDVIKKWLSEMRKQDAEIAKLMKGRK